MANAYTDEKGVFKNLLGQTDAEALRDAEYTCTNFRVSEILGGHVRLNVSGFGLERQVAIHKHLFQDVYEWAGKIRTVPSSKRAELGGVTRFAGPDSIVSDWRALEKNTTAFAAAKQLSFEEKRETLASIFIGANRIHPFPEGNGRSLQVFMKELALEQGVKLDYSKVSASDWNAASAVSGTHGRLFEGMHFIASKSDPEPIRRVFLQIASPAVAADQTKASALRDSPREDALRQHPRLVAHFQKLDAISKVVAAQSLSVEQQQVVLSRLRENMAADIERSSQYSSEPQRGPERDLDR
jgi:cell filamentation protein